jgi:hypothetical protein
MNITDRIDIELRRNYTPILNDALACIQGLTDDSNELQRLHNTLEGFDLPIDSEALSAALERAKADYMALAERYDKLSDITDKYATISDSLLYGV